MKTTISIFLLILLLAAGCKKDSETTTDPPVGVIQHDNQFDIAPDGFSPAMSYSYSGNHSITSGQPWGGVSAGMSGSELQIVAKAGRKASDTPANWFNSNVSNAACTIANVYSLPSELNFAFTGTITIEGNSYPVTMGQGNSLEYNNWWIGGPGWVFPSRTVYGEISTPDRKYTFYRDGVKADLFWLKRN
jgi:hypothetical protein